MPSMTALLGLLALAGYQNRDKLAELLKGAGNSNTQSGSSNQQGPLGGLLGNLGGGLAGGGVGGLLSGGLGELLERFKQNGQGDAAESWINKGPNKELPPPQLKQAIGPDVLAALEQQTGLSQEELLARLSRELPAAVDQYTPDGRLPRWNHFTAKDQNMSILWTIIIGFIAGVIAKFIMPGDNEPAGFILTAILGIVGAFVATFLGQALGWYGPGEGAGLIGAVVGAIIVLLVYGMVAGRRRVV
jgi:uncharacterized protein YidB (DUF937 family)/uncharacterized membrane protein YeaQ/YmgE (transglycosylase-associated protein family)